MTEGPIEIQRAAQELAYFARLQDFAAFAAYANSLTDDELAAACIQELEMAPLLFVLCLLDDAAPLILVLRRVSEIINLNIKDVDGDSLLDAVCQSGPYESFIALLASGIDLHGLLDQQGLLTTVAARPWGESGLQWFRRADLLI